MIYYAPVRPKGCAAGRGREGERRSLKTEQLEIKENYNSYNEIDDRKVV